MRDRRYEQGGVVSFLIVAVFLAVLLGAGIWWAKKMQIPAATTNSSSTSSNGTSGESGLAQTGKNEKTDGAAGIGSGSTNTNTGSNESTNSSTGSSTGTSATTPGSDSSSTSNVASTGPSTSQVPSTGPSEVVATGLLLSAGSALMYYVVQSHRRVRASALK